MAMEIKESISLRGEYYKTVARVNFEMIYRRRNEKKTKEKDHLSPVLLEVIIQSSVIEK